MSYGVKKIVPRQLSSYFTHLTELIALRQGNSCVTFVVAGVINRPLIILPVTRVYYVGIERM